MDFGLGGVYVVECMWWRVRWVNKCGWRVRWSVLGGGMFGWVSVWIGGGLGGVYG